MDLESTQTQFFAKNNADVTHFTSPTVTESPPAPALGMPFRSQPTDAPVEIFSRSRKMPLLTFSSSDAHGYSKSLDIGTALLASIKDVVNFQNWIGVKYDYIGVTITPQTTAFWRGLLGVTSLPFNIAQAGASDLTPSMLSTMPTTYIDCSVNDAVTILFPWNSPQSFIPFEVVGAHHSIVVWVAAPVTCDSAPGVSVSSHFKIDAQFVNPTFHIPNHGSARTFPTATWTTHAVPTGYSQMWAQGRRPPEEAAAKSEKGVVTRALEATAGIASVASDVGIMPTFTGLAAGVFNAAASFADNLGFDKPISVCAPQYVIDRPTQGFATFSGLSTTDVLSSSHEPYVGTDPELLASTVDMTSLDYLKSMPSLVGKTVLPHNVTTPTHIRSISVGPQHAWVSTDNKKVMYSNLARVARCFNNWRGSIGYRIMVPANVYTKCVLAITHSLTPETTFNEDAPLCYLDVAQSKTVDFVIPWIQNTPYLPVQADGGAGSVYKSSNGYINIFCLLANQGTTPGTNPKDLDLLIWQIGSSDTQLTTYLNPFFPGSKLTNTFNSPQGLFGYVGDVKLSGVVAEDDIQSLREIVHRPSFHHSATLVANTAYAVPKLSLLGSRNHWALLMSKFMYARGGVKYTLVSRGAPTNGTVEIMASDPTKGEDALTLWDRTRSLVYEIFVPFTDYLGYIELQNWHNQIEHSFRGFWLRSDVASTIHVYASLCDDLSVGVLVPGLNQEYAAAIPVAS